MGTTLSAMAHIVLFHHVLGLTPGVRALADALTAKGHQVTAPDLFDTQTFPDIDAGLAYVEHLGDQELLTRAEHACAGLPRDVVYAGLSLGVVPAEHLLMTRPGALGALLIHGFVDPAAMAGKWPDNCSVGIFGMEGDPFFVEDGDLAAAQNWRLTHPDMEIYLYPGDGHLFTEPALADYDAATTNALITDAVALLERSMAG